jgi:NADPH-dependent curcumin reductase CurA
MSQNQRLKLVGRPGLAFDPTCFELVEDAAPAVPEGCFEVAVSHVTLDVAMLSWMREGRSYVPNVPLGGTLRATSVGHVSASRHPGFRDGDCVAGLFGAQTRAISDGAGVVTLDTAQASPVEWAGALGLTTAFTAYAGLDFAGYDLAGQTVLVSGASGLVGGMAAQMAKARGARVVGIAGGAEKCAAAQEALGLDHCIDYRAGHFEAALHAHCPDRVNVFFDNVGGEIFDTTLMCMEAMGTVIMCGQTAERGAAQPAVVQNIRATILERLRIQGFVVFDRADLYDRAAQEIGSAFQAGALKIPHAEIVYTGGLVEFAAAYQDLASGARRGKYVLKT